MRKLSLMFTTLALVLAGCAGAPQGSSEVWSAEKAAAWQESHGWLAGCDYIPAYAINQLEMWQEETFDLAAIDRELGWAEDLGFNCMRVFLHHKLWESDRTGFKGRINRFLEVSASHGISPMFVFLDDCWEESGEIGPQPEPKRGQHNSGWLKDPGILYFGPCEERGYAADTTAILQVLEAYVKDIMTSFRNDDRILAWDLYNEPGGGQDPYRYYERSFPLLKDIFRWARESKPSQPITAGVWVGRLKEMNDWQIANSDIITYHTYEPLEEHVAMVDTLLAYGKPVICTEYMARTQNSTFQTIMPMLREKNVGAINWGFVSGKTNTIFSWETINSPMDADEPPLWFHDILRKDGTPYCEEEVECIRQCTGAEGRKGAKRLSVVPQPKKATRLSGHFNAEGATVSSEGLTDREIAAVGAFGEKIAAASSAQARGGAITFSRDKSLGPEAYSMKISKGGISIRTAAYAGTLNATRTLAQLLPTCVQTGKPDSADSWEIPCAAIDDSPEYPWRGVHLDCSRHFFSIAEVRKFIEVAAMYKMNRFHWHLTDDHGWRAEIRRYPLLTEIGAWRDGSQIGWDGNSNDGIRHGGFYTREEMMQTVAFADSLGVEIVPEIDMPAHLVSALASYPHLGCTGGPYSLMTRWDIAKDVLCMGKESSFEFVFGVLDEICEIFPCEYIHIGGDECPKGRWEQCPDCQARIASLGLKADGKWSAEHYLQNYFTARVQQHLASRGRKIIGWDEILEGQLAEGATVMSWRGTRGGIEAASKGFDVIMTPCEYCYLNYRQGADPQAEPVGFREYVPIEKCYSYIPVDGIPAESHAHILGVQANVWTEFIATPQHAEYMLLPRMLALAEVAWSPVGQRNFLMFKEDLESHQTPLLEGLGYSVRSWR